MFKNKRHLLPILLAILFLTPLLAQNAPHHPELHWQTVESEHFIFSYHPGTEWSVNMAMKVAESVYPYVTGLYNWEPKNKTQIIIQDTDDYANGGAYYFDNKIMIWASPLEFELRGNHQWMWNVFTHEFSHIVSLGASMKYPINIPMFYMQWIDRETPMKENIIMEYPKGIASMPVANSIVPMWWAEGVAQYQYEDAQHDSWDSHRDMILRDAALNNRIMSWADVSHFGHSGIGNEVVYNTGYAFARYLAGLYGSSVHADIAKAARNKLRFSFDKVLKDVTDISGKELYNDFADHIQADYLNHTAKIRENLVEGESFFNEGPGNFLTSYSPDGERMVFQSSQGYDYISYNYLFSMKDEKAKKISKDRVRGNVAWSPDGNTVYFAQRQKADIYGSTWFDLMAYDFDTKKLKRLTEDSRVYSVTSDAEGKLYIIRVYDGTHNIFSFDPDTKEMINLTNFTKGEQVFIMQAAPDGRKIYFDMAVNHGRDIYCLDLIDNNIEPIIFDVEYDNRTPFLSPDATYLYFSSDRTGIFNIYRIPLEDENKYELITNVAGAAMYPAIDPKENSLTYTLFKEGRFLLYKLPEIKVVPAELAKYKDYSFPTVMQSCQAGCQITEAKDYEYQFSDLFFVPFMQYDYDALKMGVIIFQNEVLDKMNLFAMADINYRGDYDINARLDFNQFLPRFYFEVFAVGLNRIDTVLFNDYWEMEQSLRFSLSEATLGVHYTWQNLHYFELSATSGSYTSYITGDIPDGIGLVKFVPSTYYKGQRIELRYRADFTRRHWQSNISPTRGWRINDLVLAYDFNKFIDDYKVTDYGTYTETYSADSVNFTPRLDLDADIFIPIPGTKHSALSFNFDIGMQFNTKIDSFFNYFGGGLPGLKGYPFYAIEGSHKAILTSTLRFPISKKLGLNLEPFSFENLYLSVYHQIGDAWTWGRSAPDWKQDVGLEARIAGHSWYGFPLALTFDLVYAMDMIQYDEFDETKTIGHNFRFYWTILFDF
jgi:WD40-like Beta Propeller Repeat